MILRAGFLLLCASLFGMSREQKVGQLFMPFVVPKWGQEHVQEVKTLVERYHVGSFLVKDGTFAQKRAAMELLGDGLLFAADAEWGVSMNGTGFQKLPKQMTVAATGNHRYMLPYGYLCGLQCRAVGIHLALGPVVDVNTCPENPVIGCRAVGDDVGRVCRHAGLQLQGLKGAGMLSCLKHFPGHGDTRCDSHLELPRIDKRFSDLRMCELVPYERLGRLADCIMVGHIGIRDAGYVPATFSHWLIDGVLRGLLGFQGVVISDAMNMGAISQYQDPGQAAVKALEAGCDLLLYGESRKECAERILREDIPAAIQAVIDSDIDDAVLDLHLKRVMKLKAGLKGPAGDLPEDNIRKFSRAVFENAVTLLRDEEKALNAPERSIFHIKERLSEERIAEIENVKGPVLVVLYTSPYEAKKFTQRIGILLVYEDHLEAKEVVDEILSGKRKPIGRCPVRL